MADYLTPVERKLKEKQDKGKVTQEIDVPEVDADPDGPNPGAKPDEKNADEDSEWIFNKEEDDVDGSRYK